MAKGDKLAIREKEEAARRANKLNEAKKVKINEDTSLPKAMYIHLNENHPKITKPRNGESKRDADYGNGRGSRFASLGRFTVSIPERHHFATLNDGYSLLRCIPTGQLVQTYDAMPLPPETAIEIYGDIWGLTPNDTLQMVKNYMQTISRTLVKLLETKMLSPTKSRKDSDP